ncbi:MAG TPA: hypothetical protein VF391_04695 [Dermatophilaceae bacterium]|jgi:hypothetical protein
MTFLPLCSGAMSARNGFWANGPSSTTLVVSQHSVAGVNVDVGGVDTSGAMPQIPALNAR